MAQQLTAKMDLRETQTCIRLSESDYRALEEAARARGQNLGEWVRLLILSRLEGQEDTDLRQLQNTLAARLLLLNILLFLAGPDGGLSPRGLKDIGGRIEDFARSQLAILYPAPPSLSRKDAPRQTHRVSARFTTLQYDAIIRIAQAQDCTPHEWIRAAILTELHRPSPPRVLLDRHLTGLLTILTDVLRVLAEGGRLDRAVLTAIKERTDPAPSQPSEH